MGYCYIFINCQQNEKLIFLLLGLFFFYKLSIVYLSIENDIFNELNSYMFLPIEVLSSFLSMKIYFFDVISRY